MPFGFGHIVFAWGLGKIYELTKKVKLNGIGWGFLIFGAILPDSDLLIDWVFGFHNHRLISHSLLGVILGFVLSIIFIWTYNKIFKKNLDCKKLGLLLAFGILTHIVADMAMGKPGVALLFPWHEWFYFFGRVDTYTSLGFSEISSHELAKRLKHAIFDIGLGAAFLFYQMLRGNLKKL